MSVKVSGALGISVVLLYLVVVVGVLAVEVWGLILTFHQSILLGIMALIVQPAPLVFGAVDLCWHVDLAARLMAWVHTLS